jgi:hypothetical protein
VTDRLGDKDALYRIRPAVQLTTPAWTWPDKPGVTGCSDFADYISVTTSTAGNLQNLPVSADGSVTGKPSMSLDGKNGPSYGRLAGMSMITPDLAVAGTVNKDGGQTVSSDDRVVLIARNPSAGTGGKD